MLFRSALSRLEGHGYCLRYRIQAHSCFRILGVVEGKVTRVWSKCRTRGEFHNGGNRLSGFRVSLILARREAAASPTPLEPVFTRARQAVRAGGDHAPPRAFSQNPPLTFDWVCPATVTVRCREGWSRGRLRETSFDQSIACSVRLGERMILTAG